MKKLLVLAVVLAVVLAIGWEVLARFEATHPALVMYGHLVSTQTTDQLQVGNQWLGTQPDNALFVMRFEGRPKAAQEPEFHTARIVDSNGAVYKMKQAIWEESNPADNVLIFAMPKNAQITAFQLDDQAQFPLSDFQRFAWLRFRSALLIAALTMIGIAILLGTYVHFKGGDKKEEHVDPFDFIKAA
ncbi:MAG: hypothetical protein PHX83_15855 [Acidobacteriia bacterium]|nr:hypothetical protein [Terriglobia bacterium]